MQDYISRDMIKIIQNSLKLFPVVLISGARQVGKSTLAIKQLETYNYISMDRPELHNSAIENPEKFINELKRPVIIDEIQKATQILPMIKYIVDKEKTDGIYGTFVLTGSANVIMMNKISETLAGRIALIELLPFSQKEISWKTPFSLDLLQNSPQDLPLNGNISTDEIEKAIIIGGYPERYRLRNDAEALNLWTQSYLFSYIERDVLDMNGIRNLDSFRRLYSLLSIQSACVFEKQNLAVDSKLSVPTVSMYLELLQQIYQISLLPSWASNIGKRFIKSPKIFLNDSGIMCHLREINSLQKFRDSSLRGNIIETFVLSELKKAVKNQHLQKQFYYMRTSDKKEIDFIIEGGERAIAIEVKSSQSADISDFKHIKFLQNERPDLNIQGIVFYMGSEIISFGKNCTAVPFSVFF
jgi:predicted AAA+ superfamily ATPase